MSETPDYTSELTDYKIEQASQGEYTTGQFDLTHEDEINSEVFDEMNADQQHMLLKEVQNTYGQEFEGHGAMTREAFSPEADYAGIASITDSVMSRRALELGLANSAPIVPYVTGPINKPASSVNTYKYQQPNETVITRSTEDPSPTQENFGLAA